MLARVPSEGDIKRVVWSLPNHKSPGLDGFGPSFYRFAWDTIKKDLVANIQNFFNTGNLPPLWNQTFVTLIPKSETPKTFTNFCPISLCNFCYKIITGIHVHRLKGLMSNMIPPSQFVFVEGCFIIDNTILAQKILFKLQHASQRDVLLAMEIDLHKAYDKINHNCIILVMQKLGFNQKWCSLISECIKSPSFSIITNGSPSSWFQTSRRIRQGDPISPYLFLFGMMLLD